MQMKRIGSVWLVAMLMAAFALACGSSGSDNNSAADGDSDTTAVDGDQTSDTPDGDSDSQVVTTPTKIYAGYAEMDATPPIGTIMGAYGLPGMDRRTTGVHDKLRGQVMAFKNDAGQALFLIEMDAAGYFFEFGDYDVDGNAPGIRDVREAIVAAVKDKIAMNPNQIVIASSHSHASTDLIGFWQAIDEGVDRTLLQNMRDGLVNAAVEAVNGMQEVDLYFGKTELKGFSGGSRNCYNGNIDESVNIIQAKTKTDGKILFTAVNFAKHPTSQPMENYKASADWIWGFRTELEKQMEGKAVFLQGPQAAIHDGADLDSMLDLTVQIPDAVDYTVAEADEAGWVKTYAIGKVLADTAVKAESSLVKTTSFDILSKSADIACDATGADMLFAMNTMGVPKRDTTPKYKDNDTSTMAIAYTINHLEVSWHKLGDAEFALFPGEATPTMGLKTKSHMVSPFTFTLALANDELGYIIDQESLDNDPSRFDTDDGELAGYELKMGLGKGGGECVMAAHESLDWYDGAYNAVTGR